MRADWRVACTTDGVKISSAVLNSNASVPPPLQVSVSGKSFQTVLANVSTEVNTASSPTNQGDEVLPAEATRSDGKTMPTRAVERSSGATDVVDTVSGEASGGECAAPSGTTGNISLPAVPVAVSNVIVTGSAESGIEIVPTVELSSVGRVWPGLPVASASAGGASCSPIAAADAPVTSSTPSRVPGKTDRPKSQTEQKNVGVLTTLTIPDVDKSKVPIITLVGALGLTHGQSIDVSAKPGKNETPASSVETQEKARMPIHGAGDRNEAAAIVSSGDTGVQQGMPTQAPAQITEPSFDASTLAGLIGGLQPTSSPSLGQTMANSPQTGDASGSVSGKTKISDGTSGTKSVTGGAGDSASQPTANGTLGARTEQGVSAKVAVEPALAKLTETGTVQAQVQTVAHEGASSRGATAGVPEAGVHAGKSGDIAGAPRLGANDSALGETAASGINSAKLVQTMGETEMHVGMHSQEFGDISIRTSVSQQQMVAQISLDHNDLSQAISQHLSTAQAKLGEEYGLHASIEINNQGAAQSGAQGNSSQRDQQSFGSSNQGKTVVAPEVHDSSSSVVAVTNATGEHGLDIRV